MEQSMEEKRVGGVRRVLREGKRMRGNGSGDTRGRRKPSD